MKKILLIFTFLLFLSFSSQEKENYIEKGKIEMANYNIDEAIKMFTLGIDNNQEKAECYFVRGLCYNLIKDYQKSVSDFTNSEKLGNNDVKLFTLRGFAYSVLGNNELALDDLNKAILINPDFYPKNYFNKASLEMRLGKNDDAINDFTIYANKTNDFVAYSERGKILLYQNKKDDACKDFEKSIELGNKDDEILKLQKSICNN
jgi:tetratricopeptide (TPR) repeat protein